MSASYQGEARGAHATIERMTKPSMIYTYRERLHIAVGGAAHPSDDEWAAYMDDIGKHVHELVAVIAVTHGGGPNMRQRNVSKLFWAKHPQRPIAVMTSSTVVRGMASALGWILGERMIRPFALRDWDGVARFLDLGPTALERARVCVDELERELLRTAA